MQQSRTFTNKALRVPCVLSEWQVTDKECHVTVRIVKLLWFLKVESNTCGDRSSSLAQDDGHSTQIFLSRIAATCCETWSRNHSNFLREQTFTGQLTLILPRSHTETVWFYTSTSNKKAARPKLYTKSLTRDLKLMYSRLTLVRIAINL